MSLIKSAWLTLKFALVKSKERVKIILPSMHLLVLNIFATYLDIIHAGIKELLDFTAHHR